TEKLLGQIGWRTYGYDYDGEPTETVEPADLHRDLAFQVARILAPELREEMRQVVREVATEVALEKVVTVIDEVMEAGFRKTNHYGEPTGEPITLREMVVAEVKGQLERPVDRSGHKADRYSRESLTYVQFVASKAAQDALKGELGEAVTEAVGEVKGRVRSIVADELAAKVTKELTR